MSSMILAVFTVLNGFADITVYTDRSVERMADAAAEFESRTGEKVNFVSGKYSVLHKRLKEEAADPKADLVFVKDSVYLSELSRENLLMPMSAATVSVVPAQMRHPQNEWVAVTYRTRTLVHDPAVSVDSINSYKDLASSEWEGSLCLRTSKSSYNQALLGYFIATYGRSEASSLVEKMIDNLAQPVFSSDRKILKAITDGRCEIGVVNSYYLAGAIAQNPNYPVAIKFLEQEGTGAHTNGTGIGLVKGSENVNVAEVLVQILLEEKAQLHLSSAHLDYPARTGLAPSTLVRNWGELKSSGKNWQALGDLRDQANELAAEVGYQ